MGPLLTHTTVTKLEVNNLKEEKKSFVVQECHERKRNKTKQNEGKYEDKRK